MKRGVIWVALLSVCGVGVFTAQAATFDSSNFSINGTTGDSIAGPQGSTNYQLVSAGGESIAGTTSSSSYKLGQGYTPFAEESLQLNAQPSGLQLHLPFEEGSGTSAYDASSNSFVGTVAGTPTWNTGKVNGGMSFNGSTNRVTIPNDPALRSTIGTLSAWVNTSVTAGSQAVIQKSSNYYLLVNAGRAALYDWSTGTLCEQSVPGFANGTWRHIAVTYSSGVANGTTLYVDGVAIKTCTMTFVNTSNPVVIGDNGTASPGTHKFNGSIDEPKIFNRILSPGEIKAEYDAGVVGSNAGVSLYNVDPGQSQSNTFDVITQTTASNYNLAISQSEALTSGSNTIPGVAGTISTPTLWSESVTTGLGFSLYNTTATAIPAKWSSGTSYAAIPSAPTTFYSRTGAMGGTKDILGVRLRLDVTTAQATGEYTNVMILTGTVIP